MGEDVAWIIRNRLSEMDDEAKGDNAEVENEGLDHADKAYPQER